MGDLTDSQLFKSTLSNIATKQKEVYMIINVTSSMLATSIVRIAFISHWNGVFGCGLHNKEPLAHFAENNGKYTSEFSTNPTQQDSQWINLPLFTFILCPDSELVRDRF